MSPISTVNGESDPDNEEIKEDEKKEEDIIRDQCPQFSDDIYENPTEEIKKLLSLSPAPCFQPSAPSTATGNTPPTSTLSSWQEQVPAKVGP